MINVFHPIYYCIYLLSTDDISPYRRQDITQDIPMSQKSLCFLIIYETTFLSSKNQDQRPQIIAFLYKKRYDIDTKNC